ncbi:MAG: diaminopimelate epimerase [Candidatus Omnitrophica bacterium]|nr:diaminopimelate epimerase [Candidatus Omnitrophota bacterium]MCF7897541.1 diaminopimelate epimerase [Candidatus Omnitrophota bacterium]MCF7909244.1 diaminopimelate epimerase [Candidatus Omnitrophota bacterium]
MEEIKFYKLQASGNDFILVDKGKILKQKNKAYFSAFAKRYCPRKFGAGADGLLVVEAVKKDRFKMRIFNADGSEAQMCGNGARCAALWYFCYSRRGLLSSQKAKLDTKAGVVETELIDRPKKSKNLASARLKIKITKPFGLKEDIPLKVMGRKIKVNFINTGVPHLVIFVEGLDKIDPEKIGPPVRFHQQFQPQGVNVNFVEESAAGKIKIRTYERGVEAETLACGTGTVASAILFSLKKEIKKNSSLEKVKVQTKGGELLKVNFRLTGKQAEDLWLEGKAHCIYQGKLAAG